MPAVRLLLLCSRDCTSSLPHPGLCPHPPCQSLKDTYAQANMAAEPYDQPQLVVTACAADATIKLCDIRMAGQQQPGANGDAASSSNGGLGVWRVVSAELKGRLSAMAVHPAAPLIAAGSSHQVRSTAAGTDCGEWVLRHACHEQLSGCA